jgi:hypothetical protein
VKVKRILCKVGIHRYANREVHITKNIDNTKHFESAILERCECGETRLAPHGWSMDTMIIVPMKYASAWVKEEE